MNGRIQSHGDLLKSNSNNSNLCHNFHNTFADADLHTAGCVNSSIWELQWQYEKHLFTNNTNVSLWQTYELHPHYISAQVFMV